MSSISSRMRITGSSGMDVESMVSQLMRAESVKLDNANKILTKLTWKQEAYRNTANTIRAYRDTYLNYTVPKTNFRSATMFNKMNVSVTSGGTDAKGISVTTTGNAKAASDHVINVKQLAEKDVYVSKIYGSDITASEEVDVASIKPNTKFDVTLDGVTKTITLEGNYKAEGDDTTIQDAFLKDLNKQLGNAFGEEASSSDATKPNKLVATIGKNGKLTIGASTGGHSVEISENSATTNKINNTATLDIDYDKLKASGEVFALEVGGWNYMAISAGDSIEDLADNINTKIKGEGFNASVVDGKIVIQNSSDNSANIEVAVSGNGASHINVTHSGSEGMGALGFTSAASSSSTSFGSIKIDTLLDFTELQGETSWEVDELDIKINNVTVTLSKDMTVDEMISAINNSDANVKMSYSTLTGAIKIESLETGGINAIDFGEDNKLVSGLNLQNKESGGKSARDAVLEIDGVLTSRASNSFDFEESGLKITLNEGIEFDKDIKISATKDIEGVIENVKTFVEQYNTLLTALTSTVNETRAKSSKYVFYEPLTDEEKSALGEKEIELWETKAKEGILSRDDTISKIISDFRNNMLKPVELDNGRTISLGEIGISTADWRDKGNLTIDEDKLRKALEERPEDVTALFTQPCTDIASYDMANRNRRLAKEGLSERLNDLIDDAIRTSVSAGTGLRGSLVEKAGVENITTTLENNAMYDQIKAQNSKVDKLITYLENKEDKYYTMFSAMENAMNKSNSQLSYISQLFA